MHKILICAFRFLQTWFKYSLNWLIKLRRFQVPVIAIGAMSVAACVQLRVERDHPSMSGDAMPVVDALTYNLAKTTITVFGTVTLNDCDSVVAKAILLARKKANLVAHKGDEPVDLPTDAPPIDVTETITISSYNQADPRYQYRIPFKNLEGWMKQLSLTVARNPNKTLASVNGTITDQAGPTVIAAAQAAIAIGGAIALPPAAAVSVPALIATAGRTTKTADVQRKMSQLEQSNDRSLILNIDEFTAFVDPKDNQSKKQVEEIFTKAQKAKKAPVRTEPNVCTDQTHKVLADIAEQQAMIEEAMGKQSGKGPENQEKASGIPAGSASGAVNPDVTRAQAKIAALIAQNHLSRQFAMTWTPSDDDLESATRGSGAFLLYHYVDIYKDLIRPNWLSDVGATAVELAPAKEVEDLNAKRDASRNVVLSQLGKKIAIEVSIQPWTIGLNPTEASTGRTNDDMAPTSSEGLLYRDPALATVRICRGQCGGLLTPGTHASDPGAIASPITADVNPDTALIETTDDIAAPMSVPITQYGRVFVQPLKNVLFQTSGATLNVNADGSIGSVGTQSSSAVAAGFSAATTAANAQTTAETNRNAAITGQNTAKAAQAGYADTYNKSLADCLSQQNSVLSAGGRPVPCQ